jgi:hypothetical protein
MSAEAPWQPGSLPGSSAAPWTAGAPDAGAALDVAGATGATGMTGTADAEEYRSLLDSARQVLDRVDRALGQLADGAYGRCSVCGAAIDDRRLEADPTALHCAEHAAAPLG